MRIEDDEFDRKSTRLKPLLKSENKHDCCEFCKSKINNLTYLDNTEDEILANVIEMNNRLTKGMKYSEESQLKQKLFWDKLKKWNNFYKYHNLNQNNPLGRISDSYLANQKDSFYF